MGCVRKPAPGVRPSLQVPMRRVRAWRELQQKRALGGFQASLLRDNKIPAKPKKAESLTSSSFPTAHLLLGEQDQASRWHTCAQDSVPSRAGLLAVRATCEPAPGQGLACWLGHLLPI